MTIVEVTLTLALMLTLISLVIFSANGISNWRLARYAGEEVRAVYLAQKNYLADHPTTSVGDLLETGLIPYLPGGRNAMPTVESLDGDILTIDFKVIPPVVMEGSSVYDPSGKDDDSLWDAGIR